MATQTLPATTAATASDALASAAPAATRRAGHPALAYVGRRVGLYAITLWGAITASFLFFHLLPGDPVGALVAQLSAQGQYSTQGGTQDVVAYYRKTFGLNGNLFDQYVQYMNRILLHQDFGPSLVSYPTSSWDVIVRALPWTIGLLGTATVLSWVIGVIGGTFVGWARRSRLAGGILDFALVLSHVPAYFVALFLVFFLACRHPFFPPNGAYDASLEIGFSARFITSVVKYGTLPVVATTIVAASGWLITTRALVVNVLGEDYLTFAEAKGLSGWQILNRYVLRNAWLPQIAALGIALGSVVNGNVLVERLFRYPGVGNLLVDAIQIKDVNTAQGIVTILIFGVLTLNLVIDLCLPLIDPRVTY